MVEQILTELYSSYGSILFATKQVESLVYILKFARLDITCKSKQLTFGYVLKSKEANSLHSSQRSDCDLALIRNKTT